MTYRLFYSPGACSLAPHIVLEELGVPYEGVRVVIADGMNQKPEYLAVNPRGRVPALAYGPADSPRILTEASAIMIFLARSHPEAGLLPTEAESLARGVEWMSWLGSIVHQTGVRLVLRPDRFIADPAAHDALKARGRETARAAFADIEPRLAGQQWLLGDRFSVVDAYLLVFFRWGNRLGFAMRQDYPNYTAIMDRVRARPAVQRVVADEGIDIE